ncbi:MAG: hypothetical protein ABSE96_21650 [Terracidiphilus sp.]|jgi:hypothetical protein
MKWSSHQVRIAFTLERGITIRKGRPYIEASLPAILDDADKQLSGILRVLLAIHMLMDVPRRSFE